MTRSLIQASRLALRPAGRQPSSGPRQALPAVPEASIRNWRFLTVMPQYDEDSAVVEGAVRALTAGGWVPTEYIARPWVEALLTMWSTRDGLFISDRDRHALLARFPDTASRCEAAHRDDPSPCDGPPAAMFVIDVAGNGVHGCVHHAAILLASVPGAAAWPGGSPHNDGIEVYRRAVELAPAAFAATHPIDEAEELEPGTVTGFLAAPLPDPTGPRSDDHDPPIRLGDEVITISERVQVGVTARAGSAGEVGLAIRVGIAYLAVALNPQQLDALLDALATAVPIPWQINHAKDSGTEETANAPDQHPATATVEAYQ